jgi:mono/diheme cytochrome c family protein
LAALAAGTWAVAGELSTSELRAIGEGRALYLVHCAGCHTAGLQGSMANPASDGSEATPANVPDLTMVAVRDGGFSRLHVTSHIRFGTQLPSFAVQPGQMPAWERALRGNGVSDAQVASDIMKLTRYLEFAQGTPPATH